MTDWVIWGSGVKEAKWDADILKGKKRNPLQEQLIKKTNKPPPKKQKTKRWISDEKWEKFMREFLFQTIRTFTIVWLKSEISNVNLLDLQ